MRLTHAKGSAYLAWHLRGQARFPFRSPAAVERAQARRVQRMVDHAYRTVPYYRETMDRIGLRPADVRSAADLARLPIVERDQIQRDPDAFLSTAQPRDRYLRLRTSGSAGAPRDVYHDAAALLQNAAHGERERSIVVSTIGRHFGYRETLLASSTGSAAKVQHFVQDRTLVPRRARIERQFLSLLDPPAEHARRIEAFRPDVIHGYGSAVGALFAHYREHGAPGYRPKLITFSSDALAEASRRSIVEDYGLPVLCTYQAIEALKIGFECGAGRGYHLNADLYPVRLVDAAGQAVPLGESGEVVVSNLVNRATVLLNYRLGDLGTLAPAPCPCGRSLPLLASLDGRHDDIIKLPSGRVINPQALRTVFRDEDRVWQYQVVQEAPARFAVAVIADRADGAEALRERVAANLAARLVDPVAIDVRFVDAIERTPGGKIRPIVSRCASENGSTDPSDEAPRDA